MSFFGVSLRNGVSLGLGTVPALSNPPLLYRLAPSLLLQFAGAETLDSRVTFTRTTTATRTNASGVIESVAINGPRFDYNPTTLAPNGLLIEEQRTNSIRNNTGVGAVAGTPGTLPTNTSYFATAGLTTSVAGLGVQSGINYVDYRFNGTTTTTFFVLAFDNVAATASAGQVWTESFYTAVVAGSTANITSLNVDLRQSGGAGSAFDTPFVPTASLTRVSGSATLLVGATGVIPALALSFSAGVAIDITLRIGLPQLELGAFATSVIPTSTAAATRTADNATMTGTNFSSWYNATEGTIYASYILGADSSSVGVFSIDDATAANTIQTRYSSGSLAQFAVTVGSVNQVSLAPSGYSAAGTYKRATAYKVNSFNQAINGVLPSSEDTSGTVPVVTQASIGNEFSLNQLNGTIKQIAFFPRRLANAELQAITS